MTWQSVGVLSPGEMGAAVATVFPDSNKKYLTTDLLRREPPREDYLAPDVELTGFSVLQRVCATCCDMFTAP